MFRKLARLKLSGFPATENIVAPWGLQERCKILECLVPASLEGVSPYYQMGKARCGKVRMT